MASIGTHTHTHTHFFYLSHTHMRICTQEAHNTYFFSLSGALCTLTVSYAMPSDAQPVQSLPRPASQRKSFDVKVNVRSSQEISL
jgi:hypothetical protein